MINPRALVEMAMKNSNMQNNEIVKSAYSKYINGDIQGLNEIAENLCKERGISMKDAYMQIQKMIGFK